MRTKNCFALMLGSAAAMLAVTSSGCMTDLNGTPTDGGGIACYTGFANCDNNPGNGCEINTDNDNENCGVCGATCGAGTTCANGKCVAALPPPDLGNTAADISQAADLITPSPDISPVADLAPAPDLTPTNDLRPALDQSPPCQQGFTLCNGACVDLLNDAANCGGCWMKCSGNHILSATCMGGICGGKCAPGWDNCDGEVGNGCETDLGTLSNCGACGTACEAVLNGTRACINASCVIKVCNPGKGNCDMNDANGCERDLGGDVENCGGCGMKCSENHNVSSCANGGCGGACHPGYADCNNDMRHDGCEVDTDMDLQNCGGCGRPCNLSHASAACWFGTCWVDTCSPGYADCNQDSGDGCETDLGSISNCGACGNACQQGQFCIGGTCRWECGEGALVCHNGCKDPASDPNNCGGCGKACPQVANGGPACLNGQCGIGWCSAGYRDCNQNSGDGCEVNMANDPVNCGGCGKACPIGSFCTGGACLCLVGQVACGGVCISTQSDPVNCGVCGKACAGGEACKAGKCIAPPPPAVDGGVADAAPQPCPDLRTLQPRDGWEVVGVFGPPDANNYPQGDFKSWGEKTAFSWCPAKGEIALLNAKSVQQIEQNWLAAGKERRADGGVLIDRCGSMDYTRDASTVFVGSVPADFGCVFDCTNGFVNLLCR